jgi:hypothetical protein
MRIKTILSIILIYFIVGSVLASDKICDFNGSVSINKSEIPAYFSDQMGCALQKTADGAGTIIIVLFCLVVLLVAYSMIRRA